MLTIHQGIITKYNDDVSPRTCDILQVPDNYVISNVRLPNHINWQNKPLIDSTVLIVSIDDYRSFLLCVLRDANDFLEFGEGIQGSTPETASYLQPGELVLESAGSNAGNVQISGTGCTIFLSNDGTINARSGKLKEYLIIGGREDDNDGEVLLVGDNGFFQSNISTIANVIPNIRSTYRFNDTNTLELGNYNVIADQITNTEVEFPISELTMTNLGLITLQNTTLGVPKAVLEMAIDGKVTLKNTLGTQEISNLGAYSFTNAAGSLSISNSGSHTLNGTSLSASMSGTVTVTGSTINFNSGTFGVARVQDIVTSDTTTDPAWWTFWSTLSASIAALPTTPLDGGATLKAGLAALFAFVPPTIISKITTGSTTVKAGG